jgi:hypothetical protein
VPKRGGYEGAVDEATRFVGDPRSRHYWDEGGRLMQGYTKKLGLSQDAWDVYFIYGPEAHWGDEPPKPDFWMHQLGPEVPAPTLDTTVFAKEALGRVTARREKK